MGREEREGITKFQDVIMSAICGVDTPLPIPIKIGVRVQPHDLIRMSHFCNKIFGGFISAGGQNPRFPIDLLVIVIGCDNYVVDVEF